jgi:hypothetical protein
MSKKPSKSKAKRSRAKQPKIPYDPVTGQQLLFDPATGKPTFSSPRLSATQVARIKARESKRVLASREGYAARRAAFLNKRKQHDSMRSRYTLPDEVRLFLERLYDEPDLGYYAEPQIARERVKELLREVYSQGCTHGFIEGVVAKSESDRKRSRTGNAGKRSALVTVGGVKMTRDERDARMATEYAALCKMMKPTPAKQRLAGKYDFESWQGVSK